MQNFNFWELNVKQFGALEEIIFVCITKYLIHIKLLNLLPLERHNVPTKK